MYEPIRHKSVHSSTHVVGPATVAVAEPGPDSLGRQLAGHLSALLSATRRLQEITGDPELTAAIGRLESRLAELGPAGPPARDSRPAGGGASALHGHAHDLAARVLVVAAARQDTTTAKLACDRMDAHARGAQRA
ncbi:SCO4983 family protein [Phaeacidiphilus oryzae]|uniref:SCO4983 family protein n=1 Tax=Phaeacidiphilus oryzae TaxID=348818 RepID=UPI000568A254|nr:hypothetical protein [Phaeacidiphilus oryzae]